MHYRKRSKPGISNVWQTQVIPIEGEVVKVVLGQEQVINTILCVLVSSIRPSLTVTVTS